MYIKLSASKELPFVFQWYIKLEIKSGDLNLIEKSRSTNTVQLLQRAREEWGEEQGILTLRGGTKASFASQFLFYVYTKNTRTPKFKFCKEASFYCKKVQLWLLMRKHSEHVAAAPFESNKAILLHKLSFALFAHVSSQGCLGPGHGYAAPLPAHLWPAVLVQGIFLLACPHG